jgi:isopentenyldiphosphate isomerase
MPRWIVDTGQLDRVLDIVRAECVVGNGYPYPLETADAVAVLTAEDRERFYRLFQQFLAEEQMELKITRKALSKRRRRV